MAIHLVSDLRQPVRTNGTGTDIDTAVDAGIFSTDSTGLDFASVLLGVAAKPSALPDNAAPESERSAPAGERTIDISSDISQSGLGIAVAPPVPLVTSAPIAPVTSLPTGAITTNSQITANRGDMTPIESTISAVEIPTQSDAVAPDNRRLLDTVASSPENRHPSAATALTSSWTMPAPVPDDGAVPDDHAAKSTHPEETRLFPAGRGTEATRHFPMSRGNEETHPFLADRPNDQSSTPSTPLAPPVATLPATAAPTGTSRFASSPRFVEVGNPGMNPPQARTAESVASNSADVTAQPIVPISVAGMATRELVDSRQLPPQSDAISAAGQQQPARIADVPDAHRLDDRGLAAEAASAGSIAPALADNPSSPTFSANHGAVSLDLSSNQPWHASPPATTQNLPVSFHDPAWNTEFGHKVLWMARNDHQQAHLTLNPPHLGTIEITVNLNPDSSATAAFIAADPEVRNTLETSLPRLREMFASAGIDLGQVSVGGESFRQSSEGRQHSPRTPRSMADKAILSVDLTGVPPAAGAMGRVGGGRVDTFA